MPEIEFVIEAPQTTSTSKKRARLVTSCDHCRLKKIKCVQQRPHIGECEACVSAHQPCLYRDREQYFAERTRLLSSAGSAVRDPSTTAQNRAHLSAIDASPPGPLRGPTPPHSSHRPHSTSRTPDRSYFPPVPNEMGIATIDGTSFQTFVPELDAHPLPSTWDGPMQSLSWSPSSTTSTGQGPDMAGLPPAHVSPTHVSPLLGLFDPTDHQQPHPNLMTTFLQVFFERLGPTYPFLPMESVCQRFLHRRLSPLLANAIAASAARLSTVREIMQIGPASAADVYCQVAKSLIPSEGTRVTIDTLHAVMLLAWAEYKRGRGAVFDDHARMATRLAAELGISNESLPRLTRGSDAYNGRVLQNTWQGVQLLERTLLASELVAHSSSGPRHSSMTSAHLEPTDPILSSW